jgi:prepilin-type N-terminal cleavage/methylation domain-containing protein
VARHRRPGARRSRRSTQERLSYVVETEWVHPDDSGRRWDAARSYAIQPDNPAKGSMRHAFTLIELTVTLCIVSILSAIAIPRAGGFLDGIHVRAAVVEIESLFSTARHLAIARASQVTVEIDTTARVIYISAEKDTLRKGQIGAEHDVRLSTTRPRMSYSATGMGYGAANLSVVVRRNSVADTVFVSRLGRLRH